MLPITVEMSYRTAPDNEIMLWCRPKPGEPFSACLATTSGFTGGSNLSLVAREAELARARKHVRAALRACGAKGFPADETKRFECRGQKKVVTRRDFEKNRDRSAKAEPWGPAIVEAWPRGQRLLIWETKLDFTDTAEIREAGTQKIDFSSRGWSNELDLRSGKLAIDYTGNGRELRRGANTIMVAAQCKPTKQRIEITE
jgi:hypothetical protein